MANRLRPLGPTLGDEERNYVYAVAMKYLKDEEAAADVTQDALLLAHRHRESFRGDSRFSTWLYRIAATTALMHMRKTKRRSRELLVMAPKNSESSEITFPDDRRAPGAGPEETVANGEAVKLVRQRLADLGDKYQAIFWMRYLEGYTESEIANRLNLSLATVKTRAHRARVAVREHLADELRAAA